MICTKVYARAALVGNPSDGYGGRTISALVKNFWAEVRLVESDRLELLPASQDQCSFPSLDEFLRDQQLQGCHGGLRLVKASIKRFAQWCAHEAIHLPAQNFRLTYTSCIPRQVGLAGSSAIVTATLRALFEFYGVAIRKELLPNLSLAVETEELGISAGLRDRVAQVYEGLTYMDFDREFMQRHGHGQYKSLHTSLLPPLYIAYQKELGESSEIVHNDLLRRFLAGDKTSRVPEARSSERTRIVTCSPICNACSKRTAASYSSHYTRSSDKDRRCSIQVLPATEKNRPPEIDSGRSTDAPCVLSRAHDLMQGVSCVAESTKSVEGADNLSCAIDSLASCGREAAGG